MSRKMPIYTLVCKGYLSNLPSKVSYKGFLS